MLISLPLRQRPRVPLGWDQVSPQWTRTLAGPGPAVRRGVSCPNQPCETGRGRPVFGKRLAARWVSKNVTEIDFRARGPRCVFSHWIWRSAHSTGSHTGIFLYTAGFSLPNGRGCDKMKENHRQLFGRFEHWIFYGKTDVLQKDAATVEKADCQNVKFGAGVKMIKNVRRSEV